ncbi:hypothetical protein LCGC14_0775640 [marine sediment metagenome]|uniref:Uncharacterized protein n=1 Tax=marine sediment metagenome TaxID=412755 RepID=A0A0F9Q189_9ZZZZ
MPTYEEIITAEIGIEAIVIPLTGAGEGSYPEIAAWISTPEPIGGPLGSSGSGRSFNVGCGFLEWSRASVMSWIDEYRYDLAFDVLFPAFMYTPDWPPEIGDHLWPEVLGKSYNLRVVAALAGAEERTCYRMEIIVDLDATNVNVPADTVDAIAFYMSSQRHTPIGAMDLIETTKIGCGVGTGNFAWPNVTDKEDFDAFHPESRPFEDVLRCALYSDLVMVQCYGLQVSSQYRTRVNEVDPWVYVDSPARYSNARIAVDYDEEITSINPKNQTRIAALEAKIEEAMNDAADEAGNKRCIDYMEITIRQ